MGNVRDECFERVFCFVGAVREALPYFQQKPSHRPCCWWSIRRDLIAAEVVCSNCRVLRSFSKPNSASLQRTQRTFFSAVWHAALLCLDADELRLTAGWGSASPVESSRSLDLSVCWGLSLASEQKHLFFIRSWLELLCVAAAVVVIPGEFY